MSESYFKTSAITRISISTYGKKNSSGKTLFFQEERPSVSDDGCKVAYVSQDSALVQQDTNKKDDMFLRDVCKNTTQLVSIGIDGQSDGWVSRQCMSYLGVEWASTN